MPRERTARQPAGPGRPTRRTRAPRSASSAAERPEQQAPTESPESPTTIARLTGRLRKGPFRDPGFTRRVLILVGAFLLLALPYGNSLRVMLNQQREIATTKAQIEQRSEQIADLDAQLQRWRDPAFVMSQARNQLGWVLPGETGYRVIGLDGKVILESGESTGLSTHAVADQTRWWDRLAVSVQAADNDKG